MKKFLFSVFLFSLFIASCSKSDIKSEQAIPSTAETVVVLNTLAVKDKLDSSSKQSLLAQLEGLVGTANLSQTQDALLKEIMNNPEESGAEINEKIFFYRGALNELGLIVKLADNDKFEDLLATLIDTEKANMETTKGITSLTPDNKTVIAWDDSRVLFVFDKEGRLDELKNRAKTQLKQQEKESILDNRIFNKINEGCKDVGIYQKIDQPMGLPINYTIAINCTFKNGLLLASVDLFNYGRSLTSMFRKFDGKFRKYLLDEDFVIQTNVDSKTILEYIEPLNISDPRIDIILGQIDGDVSLSIDKGGYYSLYVGVKDINQVRKMIEAYSAFLPITKISGPLYYIELSQDLPLINMLVADDGLHFSMTKEQLSEKSGRKLDIERDGIIALQGNVSALSLFDDRLKSTDAIDTYKFVLATDSTAYARIDFADKKRNSLNILIEELVKNKDKVRNSQNNE